MRDRTRLESQNYSAFGGLMILIGTLLYLPILYCILAMGVQGFLGVQWIPDKQIGVAVIFSALCAFGAYGSWKLAGFVLREADRLKKAGE